MNFTQATVETINNKLVWLKVQAVKQMDVGSIVCTAAKKQEASVYSS